MGDADLDARLWNPEVGPEHYGDPAKYREAIMEQYKLYVEMADRISQRRGLANSFFLTLNTAIFTALGLLWLDRPETWDEPPWALTFPLIVVLGQCFGWFYMVRSYRQLNSAKYEVVGALEQRLPASPYWRAEWSALGEGKDRTKYWPLTHIEQWIPLMFGITYVAGFVTLVAT